MTALEHSYTKCIMLDDNHTEKEEVGFDQK